MKWTVLSDNRTNNDLLQTEHGLSILLETEKYRILLDTGASDVFIRNATHLGIDLSTVDYVFISHGHSDHAGGLQHFLRINERAKVIVYNVRDLGSIPGLGRFPGEGNGNPFQYSCLENPMDRGAWCRLLSTGLQRVGHICKQ